jgi:hypothetical protein
MVTRGGRCASRTVSGESWQSCRQPSSADLRAPDYHARLVGWAKKHAMRDIRIVMLLSLPGLNDD